VIAIYAERLKQRGHQVTVVATPRRLPSLKMYVKSLLTRFQWPQEQAIGPSHFDSTSIKVKHIDRVRPITNDDVPDADVVIATWWETAEWVQAMAPAKGVKIHFMQDYEVFGGDPARVDATCRLRMPKIIIAQWVRALLKEKFNHEDITLVPNSVDPELFYAPPRGKQAAPAVGLTYTEFRNKGCDISIESYQRAKKILPDLKLVCFASCRESETMPLPAGTEFNYLVPDEGLKDIYARCDAWLFGTRVEGFGLPILEAMACRTPVIGTPAGAAPDLIGPGGGILIPHENPQAMADAIVKMCRMPDAEWRKMSDQAYRTATQYSWEDATDLFEAALQQAVDRSRHGQFSAA